MVPLVSLVSLWAFTSVDAIRDVMGLMDVDEVRNAYGSPLEKTLLAVQDERRQAMLYLSQDDGARALGELREVQDRTDAAMGELRASARSAGKRSMLDDDQLASLDRMEKDLDTLDELRGRVNTRNVDRDEAFAGYTAIIEPGYSLFADFGSVNNDDLSRKFDAMVEMARARETVTRQDALVTAALASGRMSHGEFRAFADAVAQQGMLLRLAVPNLSAEDRKAQEAFDAKSGRKLLALQERLLAGDESDVTDAVSAKEWRTALDGIMVEVNALARDMARHYSDRAEPYELKVNVYAIVVVVLGLIAIIASLVISIRIGRGLVRDLTSLRTAALELSGARLPRVMRRLAAGEEVDVRTEAPDLEIPEGEDEVAQVGQAFNDVQRAAVEAAVKQAEMRRGISEVFVNLARRSQVLLHRQLTLLDAMERRTEDAEELADLFRLDHMTTRMRRHAEGLVILSGAAPARGWRNPVMLVNVIRAAVAEVEDYERVEVRRLPRVAVSGAAVGDVTHLIAELVENATVFSPPHTQVSVHGERVANGFVLEIDDRGLGMDSEALLDANQRLAETPEFELSDTDRLGLFVVSRLARRHSVRVSLRPSPYGGTTAVVLLPNSLLTDDAEGREAGPSGAAEGKAPAGQGAHAAPSPAHRTEEAFREWGLGADELPANREADQHEQAADPAGDGDDAGPVLPRRRRSPVLVADRGRPVERLPRPAPAPERTHRSSGGDPEQPRGWGAAGRPAPAGGRGDYGRGDYGQGDQGQNDHGQNDYGQNDYGLPKRVRQANLAPQLRAQQPQTSEGAQPTPVRERSADEVRSRMASFQRGFQRGRDIVGDGDPDDGDTANRTDGSGDPVRQAPGTSTERDGR